jgi:hypothetical protein
VRAGNKRAPLSLTGLCNLEKLKILPKVDICEISFLNFQFDSKRSIIDFIESASAVAKISIEGKM